MTTTSTRLGLPYLMANQAQKHVTLNEALRQLDALVHLAAVSRSLAAEPAAPLDGDIYIVPAGPTGDHWDGFAPGTVAAFQDGAWTAIQPGEGWTGFVRDEGLAVVYMDEAWAPMPASHADRFGINTDADDTNRLAVKSDAELLSHDDITPGTGDARKIINRAGSTRTASVLFQTDFVGAAEIGLAGDDDFRLKVSADGASFIDALRVSPTTGNVVIGPGEPEVKLLVVGDNRTDTQKPDVQLLKEGFVGYLSFDVYGDELNYAPFFRLTR